MLYLARKPSNLARNLVNGRFYSTKKSGSAGELPAMLDRTHAVPPELFRAFQSRNF